MKRFLFMTLLQAMAVVTFADSRVTAEKLLIPEGKQAELTVNFNFDDGHTICNYQMEIVLPDGVSIVGEDVALGPCHTGHTGSVKNNIVVVTSMNKVISGTSGLLLKVTVEAPSLTLGTKLQGTLHNIKLGQTNETSINLADVDFEIEIVEDVTILDETSTTVPETAMGVNVRVLRTISADNWSSICLPFAMTEAQTKAAFGDDVQIADFTGCEATYDEATGENIVALKVNFENVTAMEANHPYIIKVGSDVAEFSVEGVDITPSEELSVDRDEDKYKRNGKWYYDYNSFIGTYEAGTKIPENALFLSGNKFWYSVGKTTSKAFRGYFAFYMVLSDVSTAEARISMWLGEGETTGVKSIDDLRFGVSGCYDLQGRSVEHPAKGIYVKDGRKVIIK